MSLKRAEAAAFHRISMMAGVSGMGESFVFLVLWIAKIYYFRCIWARDDVEVYGVEQYYSVIDTVTSMVKQAGAAVVFSGPYQILKSVMKSADRCREFSKNVYPLIGRCCLSLLCLAADRPEPRTCLLYTSPSPRDQRGSRMPSSA